MIEWDFLLNIRERVAARSIDNVPEGRRTDSPPGDQMTKNGGSEKPGDPGDGDAGPGPGGWKGDDIVLDGWRTPSSLPDHPTNQNGDQSQPVQMEVSSPAPHFTTLRSPTIQGVRSRCESRSRFNINNSFPNHNTTIGNENDEPMDIDKKQAKRKRKPDKFDRVRREVYNVAESQYYTEGVYTPRYKAKKACKYGGATDTIHTPPVQ